MSRKATIKAACEAVAQSLREFGYSDTTAEMVHDCWDVMMENEHAGETDMPHGIVGRFAFAQLQPNVDWLIKLPPWARP